MTVTSQCRFMQAKHAHIHLYTGERFQHHAQLDCGKYDETERHQVVCWLSAEARICVHIQTPSGAAAACSLFHPLFLTANIVILQYCCNEINDGWILFLLLHFESSGTGLFFHSRHFELLEEEKHRWTNNINNFRFLSSCYHIFPIQRTCERKCDSHIWEILQIKLLFD